MNDTKKFVLPALPYNPNDLSPTISSQTVDLHYGKHHQAYFNMLNTFAEGTKFMDMDLDEVVVKRKVTKKYYVKVKTIVKNENRTIEKKTLSFLVKGIDEREDTSAKSNEERFQLSIKSKGKKELYLYLNGDRTVSSIEIEGIKYLVRGH